MTTSPALTRPRETVGPPPACCQETAAQRHARFERDVPAHQPELLRAARRLSRNHADAEDLVQETLTRAYRSFHLFRAESNLRAWLHRILVNAFITEYRKAQRAPVQIATAELEDWQLARAQTHAASGARSAEEQMLDAVPEGAVREAFEVLPAVFQHVVYLADVEGASYREIARIIGVPHGTVTSRLHRGRRQLRTLLEGHARDRGLIPRRRDPR